MEYVVDQWDITRGDANHIKNKITPSRGIEEDDRTWEYICHIKQPNQILKEIWVKGLQFKIDFFHVEIMEIQSTSGL